MTRPCTQTDAGTAEFQNLNYTSIVCYPTGPPALYPISTIRMSSCSVKKVYYGGISQDIYIDAAASKREAGGIALDRAAQTRSRRASLCP